MDSKVVTNAFCVFFLEIITLTITSAAIPAYVNDVSHVETEQVPQLRWHFMDSLNFQNHNLNSNARVKRAPIEVPRSVKTKLIDEQDCTEDIRRLCGIMDKNNDDLFVLECVQTWKANEVASIKEECQHTIWKHIVSLTEDHNVKALTSKVCNKELDYFDCQITSTGGTYLACIIEKQEQIKNPKCLEYIQRLEWVAFSDYKIITHSDSSCQNDIEKFKCGRIQPYKDMSQGQTLACLQRDIDKLEPKCKKQVLHVSEFQADNIKNDRQLYMACTQDHIKFCPEIRPGSGQVYKCLIQHKTDRSMSQQCQDQLTRHEKLMAFDYRVSKGLVRACKEDIKTYHCRRSVSDDKDIRLAQILLCLESVVKNMSKIAPDCQAEMFDHRKILMEDYKLSPEIVKDCGNNILTFCNGLEVGGKTIHCLMEHTRPRKKKSRVAPECQRALEGLMKQTDVGEDWRLDPVLHDACQPVVDSACRDVRAGDARVISCLMEKLGTDRMTEACETALVQIQYFVARDFKLDPQLYRACRADAIHFCHAKKVWAPDGSQMDPERGPLVLPCLYRYAYHPQANMTLKPVCLEEIRRVMRQRAVNVDLQPEIEEACLNDLALYCFDKIAKGEEILCLQDKLERLEPKCKWAVGNLTEEQAEHVELNPIISSACEHVMEKHCEAELKSGKDEGDLMECLIEHKNDPDIRRDYKCRAAVEHFQLISLKSYHFTYKFKEACRPHVVRWCAKSKTKAEVIQCLSDTVQNDIIKDKSHRIPKECRQQLRAQLYQQRENIHFDPVLQTACATDIEKLCFDIEAGNSQILECLASKKKLLSEDCHKKLFNVRKQELQDSSSDFMLLNKCHTMVRQFCHELDQSQALDCLKRYKDEPTFDEKCKNVVIKRMIEQNTDYRFNPALQSACASDIDTHCKYILNNEPRDTELQGKVIKCLKIKFREAKLTTKCEQQMANILREAALNYHLNPLLATMCAQEIEKICGEDENTPGYVEECLKTQFNSGDVRMREECRIEVAYLIEQAKADINVDPLLQKACAVDVSKYCSDVPQGAGRHIMCLQNIMEGHTKALQPDCYKMLSTRIEMFRNAAELIAPNSIGELYSTVNRSPARRYFMVVAFSLIGVVFIIGLFCGKVARRTLMMKNK
ncbi:Golgi apparatus protein 1 [Athalia rosae]|uniref:Golgi apparatus protein 1 n=1 Tax=Athalia rosae TaxID=37344 RepID=UPI00203402F7|nr:Golgi apparatus protein 1 [Athalia rosae]XP_048508289.1 Golgi apparatus protein 1 [Athalia rosae]